MLGITWSFNEFFGIFIVLDLNFGVVVDLPLLPAQTLNIIENFDVGPFISPFLYANSPAVKYYSGLDEIVAPIFLQWHQCSIQQ